MRREELAALVAVTVRCRERGAVAGQELAGAGLEGGCGHHATAAPPLLFRPLPHSLCTERTPPLPVSPPSQPRLLSWAPAEVHVKWERVRGLAGVGGGEGRGGEGSEGEGRSGRLPCPLPPTPHITHVIRAPTHLVWEVELACLTSSKLGRLLTITHRPSSPPSERHLVWEVELACLTPPKLGRLLTITHRRIDALEWLSYMGLCNQVSLMQVRGRREGT